MTTSRPAWVITGPTSGIGYRTALELARHGTVVLVGRSAERLDAVRREIEGGGGTAVAVVADLSDVASTRAGAEAVAALGLPIRGVLNNAGIFPTRPGVSAQGWDLAYATNHVGPFVFTETLLPSLADGAHVVFIVSAAEDPDRTIAVRAGFRGGRYVSAEASTRGEWLPGGSTMPGGDAYATSKQLPLATALAFAREFPRLRFAAIEPGVTPGSDLGRDAGRAAQVLGKVLGPVLQVLPHFTTPKRAAKVIAGVLTSDELPTGGYLDENGRPMLGSVQVRDPGFQDRVVAETRALLRGLDARP
jgi:NAD(P)-dependent dehydrogenase (short-subunit alcohol dehydrogenase family)